MLLIGLVGVIVVVIAIGTMLGQSGKGRSPAGGMDRSSVYLDAGSSEDHDGNRDSDSGGDDGGLDGGDGGGGDGGSD